MNDNLILIGAMYYNGLPTEIRVNGDTGEVIYEDDTGYFYVLTGFSVDNIPTVDAIQDIGEEVSALPSGITGVVYDGEHKWFLRSTDMQAFKVHVSDSDASTPISIVDYDDSLEYDVFD